MTELTKEILDQLAEPFPADVIEFKPGATNNPKTKALALAYVEVRHYIDRLNAVVGADWSDEYQFINLSGELISCGLTICGVTRWDIGEKETSNKNTATSALAQSFKRACVKFGLGRHLYAIEKMWVPYDKERKQFTSQAFAQLRRMVSGEAPKPQEKSPNGNGTEPLKAAFFARVLSEIPYYEHVNHVTNALKQAGFTAYSQAKEDKMFAALQKHASEAANQEAA